MDTEWVDDFPEVEPPLEADAIVPWVEQWIDEQTQRPAVLSYADFNTWAQFKHDLIFTLPEGLIAYERVAVSRFDHSLELMRVIRADEWVKFYDQYGGLGMIAGVIDQKSLEAAPKTWFGKPREADSVRVVYYFSEPQEAAFARMAF